ncbi:hypothetical protein TNCV_2312931 [Trichonephila clavipes]|nr:hypothetical protein TNCV_2312931 [Trichonephila clavipes]
MLPHHRYGILSSGWARSTRPLIPSVGQMNTKLVWGLNTGVSLQTDHLIGTSAHVPNGHVNWDGPTKLLNLKSKSCQTLKQFYQQLHAYVVNLSYPQSGIKADGPIPCGLTPIKTTDRTETMESKGITALEMFKRSEEFLTSQSTSVNVLPVVINNCQLQEDGQELAGSQRTELDSLLRNNHSIFEVRGEATPFIEHSINIENNPPTSVPPYWMNPARKGLLKK